MEDNPAPKRKRLRSQTLRRWHFCGGREQVPGRRDLFCFPCPPQTFTSRWVKPRPWGLTLPCARGPERCWGGGRSRQLRGQGVGCARLGSCGCEEQGDLAISSSPNPSAALAGSRFRLH